MNSFIVLILMIFNLILISSESCERFKTCGECIGNTLSCVWCSAEKHNDTRCQSSTFAAENKSWCEEEGKLYDPIKSELKYVKNDALKSADEEGKNSVQLTPQIITIKARPGVPVRFNMSYKPAQHYPLDIYYLMDSSFTMKSHLVKLINQTDKIYSRLTNLTNNVRFGAGSYVEKLALPYASPVEHTAYSFKNHLSLTNETEQFKNVVRRIQTKGNYDDPESGLDALMQAMVCLEDINWRADARRMIILSTDSTYHSAGDGKMVGAIKPNDMQCHLKDGTHDTESSLQYDYPSVSQINKIAHDQHFTIIFAVLEKVIVVYEALKDKIQGAKCTKLSMSDSDSDLEDMIEKEYRSLVRDLEMSGLNYIPQHIDLQLSPPCNKNDKCEVQHDQPFNFDATLTVKSCPIANDFTQTFQIGPVGLTEKLTITVVADCQCVCETDGSGLINSRECSDSGTYQCGVCKCNQNRYGDICECPGTSTTEIALSKCKNKNDTTLCSGRGTCSCGECVNCEEGFSGTFCEYSIYDCPTSGTKLCGGHGKCINSLCNCTEGWTGDDCTCTLDLDPCRGPNLEVCSGHGECKCGKCIRCFKDENDKTYSGEFCHYRDQERCEDLEDYAECNFNENKTSCDPKFKFASEYEVHILNKTEINALKWRKAIWCAKILADGSSILFRYLDKDMSTTMLIQREKEMPAQANIWVAIGSALGVTLLIGLLTVIAWKFLVDMYDAREYKRFAQEATAAGYEVAQNPLYQPPAVNINNPVYQGN